MPANHTDLRFFCHKNCRYALFVLIIRSYLPCFQIIFQTADINHVHDTSNPETFLALLSLLLREVIDNEAQKG